jgi:hypothetical protein
LNKRAVYALILANVSFPIILEFASTASPLRFYASLARILVPTAYFAALLLTSRRVYASVLNTLLLFLLTYEYFKTPVEFFYAVFLSLLVLYFSWSRKLVALNLPGEVEEVRSFLASIKKLRRPGLAGMAP